MYFWHRHPAYDPYYPRLHETIILGAENRVLNREVGGLIRQNIRLRTQILERDYSQLDSKNSSSLGLSKEAQLERLKYRQAARQEQSEKKIKEEPKLNRDYSFGRLNRDKKQTDSYLKANNSVDRYHCKNLTEKPFAESRKYQHSTEPRPTLERKNTSRQLSPVTWTFIESLNEEKLNPEGIPRSPTKRQNMSQVKSEEYNEQTERRARNNQPYRADLGQQSPYKKLKQAQKKEKGEIRESLASRQSTSKKQFINIFSKAFESVRDRKGEEEKK